MCLGIIRNGDKRRIPKYKQRTHKKNDFYHLRIITQDKNVYILCILRERVHIIKSCFIFL